MDEPSVLDYVKAKLAFWKQPAIDFKALDAPALAPEDEAEEKAFRSPEVALEDQVEPAPARVGRFPWLPLAALLLAVIGQILLEPPDRLVPWAVGFYALASLAILAAYYRREIQTSLPPAVQQVEDDLTIRWEGVLVGIALMLLAFLTFGAPAGQAHDFNFINTTLWLLSIIYLVWALAQPSARHTPAAYLARFTHALRQPSWRISMTRWTVLVLVVAGIALFYRWYRLPELPAEMVSDHAEKLLDVQDVLNGDLHVFFPRNTGREFFQFYWTVLMIKLFSIPVSFMALKVGTVIAGLITLVYIYRLGFELGNKWVALFALAFCGVSYWANIQSRIGLRFPLYPLFTAPLLFYLLRGLRTMNRNDFIKAGLVLGLGLHGYTSFRIVPVLVVLAFVLYILHERSIEMKRRAVLGLAIVTLISLAVFVPLLRFAFDDPQMFGYRSLSRMSGSEHPLPGSPVAIFFQNTANALLMFQWENGDVWVHSVTNRPALDAVSAALFFLGVIVLLGRYLRSRRWVDLFLLLSIPILLLPSILSLAFPNENPNLNRTAAAYIPAFLIVALMIDTLVNSIRGEMPGRMGAAFSTLLVLMLFGWAAMQNYELVFQRYDTSFRLFAWNSTEMGAEVRAFENLTGSTNTYVVAYPYWVDTRLVGIEGGHPYRDLAIQPDQLATTLSVPDAKLFLLKPEDTASLARLRQLYREGKYWLVPSQKPTKKFIEFTTLPSSSRTELPQGGPK